MITFDLSLSKPLFYPMASFAVPVIFQMTFFSHCNIMMHCQLLIYSNYVHYIRY